MSRRIVIVLNPAGGHGRAGRRRPELEHLLAEASAKQSGGDRLEWRIEETTAPGSTSAIAARCAADGADIVAAAGGDGTLSEVLNGLMGTNATLALLPFGTGNDFSRTVGLYGSLPRAVDTLFTGTPRRIDVGQLADRYFLNVAGCGFDAVVAESANHGPRQLTGTAAYLWAVIRTLARFRAADFRVTVDSVPHILRAMMCSVANAQTYGGGMRIAPTASLDDGLFDLCLLKEAGTFEFIRAFPSVFKGTHTIHPKITMLQGRHIRIESTPPLPILIDGEVIGTTPAEFTLLPAAIEFQFPTLA